MPTMPEGGDTPRSRDNGRQRGLLDLEQPGLMPVSRRGWSASTSTCEEPGFLQILGGGAGHLCSHQTQYCHLVTWRQALG